MITTKIEKEGNKLDIKTESRGKVVHKVLDSLCHLKSFFKIFFYLQRSIKITLQTNFLVQVEQRHLSVQYSTVCGHRSESTARQTIQIRNGYMTGKWSI